MEGPPVAPPAEALLASHYNSRGTYQTAAVREQYLPVGSARSLENHARPVCSSFIRGAVEAGGSREDGRAAYRAAVTRSLSAVVGGSGPHSVSALLLISSVFYVDNVVGSLMPGKPKRHMTGRG